MAKVGHCLVVVHLDLRSSKGRATTSRAELAGIAARDTPPARTSRYVGRVSGNVLQ